jgi:KaiC/GvpD/RAD55 family RecA-like ATPase
MSEPTYAFDGLPLDSVRRGTSILVAGPSHVGTKELAYRMLAGDDDEGVIILTTNTTAADITAECETVGIEVSPDRMGIVDCLDSDDSGVPARVLTVSSAQDLTGIGMRYSKLYSDFHGEGIESVRTGLFSISTVLSLTELQTVSRFVHTLVGRVSKVGGLGVFLVDPAMHDERELRTISQFCDGRIDVRKGENGPELRSQGFLGGSSTWLSFEPLSNGG